MLRRIAFNIENISGILKKRNICNISGIASFWSRNSEISLKETSWRNDLVTNYQHSLRFLCQVSNVNNENGEKQETEERDSTKDRSKVIPPETSIRYLKSKAYHETYQEKPVWFFYRRNFKGGIAPRTRKTCIRNKMISTGSPCPICRDEYLVLDYTNVELLKQFVSPQTGEVYSTKKTGLCQKQHMNLLFAIDKAKDCGFITVQVPFRKYNYEEFYPQLAGQ